MQTAILEPKEVLAKLQDSTAAPNIHDKILLIKDGHTKKATYHTHIQTLFSLFALTDDMQAVLQFTTFIPSDGIRARLFAKLISHENMDTINNLVELGFIQNPEMYLIALHPLVQETIIADLHPPTPKTANLHMNLGYLYQADGQLDLARQSMEKAMQIIAEVNYPTHDVIIMSRNYARLLAETGEARRAITALKKCADFVKATNSEMTCDYADILFDIAAIISQTNGIQATEQYFVRAFKIYRDILPESDLREKAVLAVKYFERAGITKIPEYLTFE